MKYIQTEKKCSDNIGEKVCGYCGYKLEPIETVDNINRPTYWQGCKKCQRFNAGVSLKIYKFVTKYDVNLSGYEKDKACRLIIAYELSRQ